MKKLLLLLLIILMSLPMFAVQDSPTKPCLGQHGLKNIMPYYYWREGNSGYLVSGNNFDTARFVGPAGPWCQIKESDVVSDASSIGSHWTYGTSQNNVVSLKLIGYYNPVYRAVLTPESQDNVAIAKLDASPYGAGDFLYTALEDAYVGYDFSRSELKMKSGNYYFSPSNSYWAWIVFKNIDKRSRIWVPSPFGGGFWMTIWLDTENLSDSYTDFVIYLVKNGNPMKSAAAEKEISDYMNDPARREFVSPDIADDNLYFAKEKKIITMDGDDFIDIFMSSDVEEDEITGTVISEAIDKDKKVVGVTIESIDKFVRIDKDAALFLTGKTIISINNNPVVDFPNTAAAITYLISDKVHTIDVVNDMSEMISVVLK